MVSLKKCFLVRAILFLVQIRRSKYRKETNFLLNSYSCKAVFCWIGYGEGELRKTSYFSHHKINNNNSNTVYIKNWAAFPVVLQSKYTARFARFQQAVFATSSKTLAQSIEDFFTIKLVISRVYRGNGFGTHHSLDIKLEGRRIPVKNIQGR